MTGSRNHLSVTICQAPTSTNPINEPYWGFSKMSQAELVGNSWRRVKTAFPLRKGFTGILAFYFSDCMLSSSDTSFPELEILHYCTWVVFFYICIFTIFYFFRLSLLLYYIFQRKWILLLSNISCKHLRYSLLNKTGRNLVLANDFVLFCFSSR